MTSDSLSALLRRYLARRLLAPGIAFVLVVAIVLGGQRWLEIQRAQDLQTQAIARYVSTYLESADEALNFLAQLTPTAEFPTYAERYHEHSHLFERILFLNDTGEVLQAFPSTGALKDYSRLMPASLEPQSNLVRLSAPYLAPLSNNLTVSLFSANVQGKIVAGELNLVSLQSYIANLAQIQPGIVTFITDGFGTLIAHPNRTAVEQQTNLGHLVPVSQALGEATGFMGIHRMQGAWYLFNATKVSKGAWVIFSASSAGRHLMPLAVALSVFISLLFFLIIAAVWLLNRKLRREVSEPLESFIEAVTHLEKGALKTVRRGAEKTFGELGILRQRFTEMAEAIVGREQSLRESEEKFRRLIENLGKGYFFYQRDVDEFFIYLSPSIEAMLGYAPRELLGRHRFGNIITTSLINEQARESSLRALQGQHSQAHEVEVCHKDGSIRLLEVVEVPVRDFQGSIVGLDGIARDITEQKKANEERLGMERQLLHSQKLESLGVLASGIAHDFNNLLAAILGNLELALIRAERNTPLYTRILQAFNAGQRAAELTRQMLAYSGKGQLLVEEIDLSGLVRENIAMLQAVMAKTVTLDLQLAADMPPIMADAGQIQQVTLNLITNASEAMGDQPGTMTLVTGVMDCSASDLLLSRTQDKPGPGRYVFLEVRDTGCGMDEQTRQRLFDPFFSTKFTGRGLGMAAVLGIVQGHRGAIFVESEPGQGSMFRVLFPAVAVSTDASQTIPVRGLDEPCALQPTPGSELILVVDDEPMVLELCVEALHSLGYQSLQADNGEQAVRLFREHAHEVRGVILDLTMPKMNGVAALQEMRKIRPDVQVILCSGYNEQEAIRGYLKETPTSFLKKPFSLKQLQTELENMRA
jgi:PAS domain S-box-containing protein